jgi:hypothetical protein
MFYSGQKRISSKIIPTLKKAKWWGRLDFIKLKVENDNCQTPMIASAVKEKKPSNEIDTDYYEIESIKDFNIPQSLNSSLTDLSLIMNYKIKSDDFKNVFEENRFPNITEVRLEYDWGNEGEIGDLIAEVANSCPNVKKFVIRTEDPSTVKSFKAILTKCKKLEILKLISVGNYKLPSEIENVFPDICRNWPNLRYLELTDWQLSRKQGRYLIVHCDQLQAVISGKSLFVKSSAQMSEVATFFDEWVYHEFIICNKIFVH